MDHSLPGLSVYAILQARVLQWVAIPCSSGSFWPRDQTEVSLLQADSLLSESPGKPMYIYIYMCMYQFTSVQSLSHVWLFVTCEPQHARPPCPSPTPRVNPNLCPSSQWCHPTISSSVVPFSSCLQSFPASGSFEVSQFFTSGGQNVGVSASTSVFPMNTQDWSPLGWTGWVSLQSKGLSRVFSNITVRKHQFFGAQLSSQSSFHIHTWPLEKP